MLWISCFPGNMTIKVTRAAKLLRKSSLLFKYPGTQWLTSRNQEIKNQVNPARQFVIHCSNHVSGSSEDSATPCNLRELPTTLSSYDVGEYGWFQINGP